MDISSLGPVFYLTFALPGFIGVWSLRLVLGYRRSMGEWAWAAWSAIYGMLLAGMWSWIARENPPQLAEVINNPFAAFLTFSFLALLISLLLGMIKALAYAVTVGLSLLVGIWDEFKH